MTDDRPGLSASDECTAVFGERGCDDEAVVQASLDGTLEDLVRAAVEAASESYAVRCARIEQVFDARMAPHRHLTWARLLAEGLKTQLKVSLRRHVSPSVAARATHGSKLVESAASNL